MYNVINKSQNVLILYVSAFFVTKSHNFRSKGSRDSYCSTGISVECLESGHEILLCYRGHPKVDELIF